MFGRSVINNGHDWLRQKVSGRMIWTKKWKALWKTPKPVMFSSEQKKMLLLLEEWQKARTLLKVEVFGFEGAFQSFLIKLDSEKGVLVLDDLFPSVALSALLPGQKFKISTVWHGIEYQFEATCQQISPYGGCLLYTSPSPRDA